MEVEVARRPMPPTQLSSGENVFSEAHNTELSSLQELASPPGNRSRRVRRKGSRGTRHSRPLAPAAVTQRSKPYPEAKPAPDSKRPKRKNDDLELTCPGAPYNTTQFIMAEHDNSTLGEHNFDPDLTFLSIRRRRSRAVSESLPSNPMRTSPTISLPCLYSRARETRLSDDSLVDVENATSDAITPEFEEVSGEGSNFEADDFSNTYTNVHVDSLRSMSKEALIREVLRTEARNEELEARVDLLSMPEKYARVRGGSDVESNSSGHVCVKKDFIKCLQREICTLRAAHKIIKEKGSQVYC